MHTHSASSFYITEGTLRHGTSGLTRCAVRVQYWRMDKASGSSDNVVSFPEIDSFMSDRSTAEYRWAKQVTFDGNITAMNARSLLIEDEWRRLASSVRQVFPGLLTYGGAAPSLSPIASPSL